MFQFIKRLFQGHDWRVVSSCRCTATYGSLLGGATESTALLEIHRCENTGKERAVISNGIHSQLVDLNYAKTMFKEDLK